MKSPQDMRIIQIDITNACVFQCSNCTRFCGHHKKPFFMDFDTFKEAVDSLDGYVGTIGMMGGEPTLNPDFERMAEYLASKKPPIKTDKMLRPQRHFMDGIHDLEFEHTFLYPCKGGMRQTVDGPGLWATTKGNYKKYYETIQDTAQYQALNDHSRAMYHQPALISRKALGIPDGKWETLRDSCWIQNEWSASITPKGAFFCEVAASLDMLFDGPGGWRVEPNWWKREPDDFKDQLHWCEICGLACKTYMRNANEQVYDVSEDIYGKLKEHGSRLVGTDHINVVKITNGVISEESKAEGKRFSASMPYTESYSARYDEEKTGLVSKKIKGLIVCRDFESLDYAVHNVFSFDEAVIFATGQIIDKIRERIKEEDRRGCIAGEVTFLNGDEMTLKDALAKAVGTASPEIYIMAIEGLVKVKNAVEQMSSLVLNPGTLLSSFYDEPVSDDYFTVYGNGSVALFSGWAKSFKNIAYGSNIKSIGNLEGLWNQRKVFPFSPESVYTAPTVKIYAGERYLIYGAGTGLRAAIDSIAYNDAEIIAVVDSDEAKWGTVKLGFRIDNPAEILNKKDRYDRVMIASPIYYREIKAILLKNGVTEDRMAWI